MLLEAIRNILKVGQTRLDASGNNPYLLTLEQCGGIDAIELLQVRWLRWKCSVVRWW